MNSTDGLIPKNGFSWDVDKFDDVEDSLNRKELAETIAKSLRDPNRCPDGRIVGLYGSWGAGKSHVLSQVIKQCLDQNASEEVYIVPCIFKAWRYETEGDLAPGLIRSLLKLPEHESIRAKLSLFDDEKAGKEYKKIAKELLDIVAEISLAAIPGGKTASDAAIRISKAILGGAVDASTDQPDEDDSPIEKAQRKMKMLVDNIYQQTMKKQPDKTPRLVIFIDDLDRCSPKNMVRLFEWLKNHLLVENCVYVLALDHVAAARAIVGEYKNYLENDKDLAYGLRYLEKLVDIEYELGPSAALEAMTIHELYAGNPRYSCCTDLTKLAEAIAGTQFAGFEQTRPLLQMQCLQTPRTLLKIVTKFSRAIERFQGHPYDMERQALPTYPFWLLFMSCMYYRLDPDELSRFVAGELSIYKLMTEANAERRSGTNGTPLTGPLADFETFSAKFQAMTGGKLMPSESQRPLLAKLIHQS